MKTKQNTKHTPIAHTAMLCAKWSQATATMAKPCQTDISFLPFFKVRNLSNGSIVLIRVQWDVTGVTSICNDPTNPHNNIPIDKAIMRFPQEIPSLWYYTNLVKN